MRPFLELSDWQRLVKLLGEDEAAALSATYGGGRMSIPKFVGAHHPIAEILGPKATAVLVGEFGGRVLDVPISLGKRAAIKQMLEGGQSVSAICRRVGVSRRHVFYVKAELRDGEAGGDQPDLFSGPR